MPQEIPVHYAPLTDTFTRRAVQVRGGRIQVGTTGMNTNTGIEALMGRQGPTDLNNLYFDGADPIADAYINHSSGQRTNTDTIISAKLRSIYKDLALTVVPAGTTDLLTFAGAGNATIIPQEDPESALGLSHRWRRYAPPARRMDKSSGTIVENVIFGKFILRWTPTAAGRSEEEFILYIVSGRDGCTNQPDIMNQYILASPEKQSVVKELLIACGLWLQQLRGEIWVFDQGFWQKSTELWEAIKNASWEDVILDESTKTNIRSDIEGFYNAQATYNKLKVPWRRGIIFHGPPGNGKTISIKAILNKLQVREEGVPVSMLYVRSFKSVSPLSPPYPPHSSTNITQIN